MSCRNHPKCDDDVAEHTGDPYFEDSKIGDDVVYIAELCGTVKHHECAIIIFPNSGGITVPIRLLADAFAKKGYMTIAVNTQGIVVDPYTNETTRTAYSPAEKTRIAGDTLTFLLDSRFKKFIGVIGYCAGASYAMNLLTSGNPVIKCGYLAHPVLRNVADRLELLTAPLSIAAAQVDVNLTPRERGDWEVMLGTTNQQWQIAVYSGVNHGFGVRSPVNEDQKRSKRLAFGQAVKWFDEWMGCREPEEDPPVATAVI